MSAFEGELTAVQEGGLRTIRAERLFGLRDYSIDLEPHRPTVLTGANGTGKSTLLGLVNAVSAGSLGLLLTAPLHRLELEFDALPDFSFQWLAPGEAELRWGPHREQVRFDRQWPSLPDWATEIAESGTYSTTSELEEALSDEAQNAGVPFADFREVVRLIREADPAESLPPAPDWFDDMRAQFPVLFVSDQRLVVEETDRGGSKRPRRSKSSRRAVEAASANIATQMRRVDSTYARSSQLHDRQFPREVIQAMTHGAEVPREELDDLFEEVGRRRDSLLAVGLLDREQGFERDIAAGSLEQEQVRRVITTFLESTLRKLEVLEELASRLRIFKSFVDDRFAGKTMNLSRQQGVEFQLADGAYIRPAQLSSGEQQILVLAYEILFRARPGTLVIVDEPEISLHVLWQDTLIESLSEMATANRLQFLMATHSPVLLASHPELERSLDDLAF